MFRARRSAVAFGAMFAVTLSAYPALCRTVGDTDMPPSLPTSPQTVPEATEPGMSGSSTPPLSDRLDRTDGVIRPPAGIDPHMHREPPPTGPRSTPVIPPPGTRGDPSGPEPK